MFVIIFDFHLVKQNCACKLHINAYVLGYHFMKCSIMNCLKKMHNNSVGILLMCFHFQQHFSAPHYGPNNAVISPTGSSYFLTWVLLPNNTTAWGGLFHTWTCVRGEQNLTCGKTAWFAF